MGRVILTLLRRTVWLAAGIFPFRELCDLLEDGITVESRVGEHLVMRTVIQLDGDVMTFAVPTSNLPVSADGLRDKHWSMVDNVLRIIAAQLGDIARMVTLSAALLYFAMVAAVTLQDFSPATWDTRTWIHENLIHVAIPLILGAIGYVSPFRRFLEPLCHKVLRFLTRQRRRRSRIDALLRGE